MARIILSLNRKYTMNIGRMARTAAAKRTLIKKRRSSTPGKVPALNTQRLRGCQEAVSLPRIMLGQK